MISWLFSRKEFKLSLHNFLKKKTTTTEQLTTQSNAQK